MPHHPRTHDLVEELQTTLGDAYAVERELGGGGMSRVFLARDTALHRRTVVKVLPGELAARISAERFRREIRIAATLQHPHIVPLLTASASGDVLYYTMPFVDGESLRERLAREPRLPVDEALRIARDVADALAHAHARGVVHRDIKPGNVLLAGGHAVVTDFGIARAISRAERDDLEDTGDDGRDDALTGPGSLVGTPAYMSPEQALGRRDLDERSDVYAVGCVLHEMLTGAPPFAESGEDLLLRRVREPPPRPSRARPDVTPAVDDVVRTALATRPEDRYADAAELRAALDRAAEGGRSGGRWARPAAWGAVALAAVAAAVALRPRSPLDADLLAVEPIHVGRGLGGGALDQRWGDDLAVILATNLDGAGPLRTVPPSRFLRGWTPRGDAGSAAELARLTGAGLVVVGRATPLGADSARVTAMLYDARRRRTVDAATLDVPADARLMAAVSDSLTYAVLRALGRARALGTAGRATLGAAVPLPALRAYLEGERHFRAAAWDSALAAYARAGEAHATFALALSRIGRVLSWQRVAQDSLARAYALRAGALNRGLGPHDSLLVLADSVAAAIDGTVPDAVQWARTRRLLAVLGEATGRYSDSPLAWYALGEARMHFGGPLGVPARAARDAFDRVLALDSAFSPAYVHSVELAIETGGAASALPYVRAYLAHRPGDPSAGALRLVDALLAGGAPAADSLLAAASADDLFRAWIALRRWADPEETAVRLLRALVAGGRATSYEMFDDARGLRRRLAAELAYHGHLDEAALAADGTDPRLLAELAHLGAVPPARADSALARLARDAPDSALPALPWWAERGDTATLVAYRAAAARLAGPRAAVARESVRGYLALARGDTAGAVRALEAIPDSLCADCWFRWLTLARLHAAAGRDAAAAAWLGRWYTFPPLPYPSEVEWSLLRGTVAERTGDRAAALGAYCRVVALWGGAPADRRLARPAAAASAGLARLGAPAPAGCPGR